MNSRRTIAEKRMVMLLATTSAGFLAVLLCIALSYAMSDYYKITFCAAGIACGMTAIRSTVNDNVFTRRSAVVISMLLMVWGIFAAAMLLESGLNAFSFDSWYYLAHRHTAENFMRFMPVFFEEDIEDLWEVILTGILAYYFAVDVTVKQP